MPQVCSVGEVFIILFAIEVPDVRHIMWDKINSPGRVTLFVDPKIAAGTGIKIGNYRGTARLSTITLETEGRALKTNR